MLSPRMAKVLLDKYRKDNPVGIADSSRFAKYLEPKFGWGHEAWVKELAQEIKKMQFDGTWTPTQVLNYVSNFVASCERENPSSIKHPHKPM